MFDPTADVSHSVHSVWPEQKLAYNLSPSFNWKAAMPVSEQETYIARLAKLGYCWQFITLAGLHQAALMANQFSKAYVTFPPYYSSPACSSLPSLFLQI